MEKTWTVVKFLEENSVEAVPTHWIIGNTCVWPPYPREKVINSIRTYEDLNTCWPSHQISIFRNGTYNSYLEARNKTKIAEYSSDLNEEDSKSRKYRKKKNHILSSESESEEDKQGSKLPSPPSKPKNTPHTNGNFVSNPPPTPINQAPPKSPSDLAIDKENCLCCPIHGMQKIDETMKKISKQYYLISSILTDVSIKLETLRTNEPCQNSQEVIESFLAKFQFFPLKNSEDLITFEEYLGDKNNFRTACNEISRMGGCNLYEFIKRCMSQLLTNLLASTYSYHGRKNKLKFVVLKIADLLLCAAEKAFPTSTKKEIEECIMKWLRRANERK